MQKTFFLFFAKKWIYSYKSTLKNVTQRLCEPKMQKINKFFTLLLDIKIINHERLIQRLFFLAFFLDCIKNSLTASHTMSIIVMYIKHTLSTYLQSFFDKLVVVLLFFHYSQNQICANLCSYLIYTFRQTIATTRKFCYKNTEFEFVHIS